MPPILEPERFATEDFFEAGRAVARIVEIYEANTAFLRGHFEAYLGGNPPEGRVRACYPFVRITTGSHTLVDSRLAYGFVAQPGVHQTTVTQPDLFRAYLLEQIGLLLGNHDLPVEIGVSEEPIPVHFAYQRDVNLETEGLPRAALPPARPLRDVFDVPDLASMDDTIVNGTLQLPWSRRAWRPRACRKCRPTTSWGPATAASP